MKRTASLTSSPLSPPFFQCVESTRAAQLTLQVLHKVLQVSEGRPLIFSHSFMIIFSSLKKKIVPPAGKFE